LYTLTLTVDANFRLKNKARYSTDDRALGDGWAHLVMGQPYHEYVQKYGYQEEVILNVCLSHYLTQAIVSQICANRIYMP